MATNKVCDRCGNEAVAAVEVKSDRTTTVMADLCQDCFLEFKWFLHWLTGQEQGETVKKEDAEHK